MPNWQTYCIINTKVVFIDDNLSGDNDEKSRINRTKHDSANRIKYFGASPYFSNF